MPWATRCTCPLRTLHCPRTERVNSLPSSLGRTRWYGHIPRSRATRWNCRMSSPKGESTQLSTRRSSALITRATTPFSLGGKHRSSMTLECPTSRSGWWTRSPDIDGRLSPSSSWFTGRPGNTLGSRSLAATSCGHWTSILPSWASRTGGIFPGWTVVGHCHPDACPDEYRRR